MYYFFFIPANFLHANSFFSMWNGAITGVME